MAKRIAKREVGLGLNISEFAKSAKTAEELLDKITQGRTISLDAKLNLGDAQAVLQKILDQKTVSIRTALDVKDLMSIMEKSIADFEQRGSSSLAKMNRRFLEEFQTGLGSVNFKLDDGTLIGGYQKAIEQANNLNLLSEKQGKIADEVANKTRKQTVATKQQAKATDELNKSVEKQLKLNKMKNDSGKIVPQTYTAVNGQYEIQKGAKGWNLYETDTKGQLKFITAYETLNELKRDSTLIAEQEAIAQNKLTKKKQELADATERAADATERQAERETQLSRISALRQEELDLIKQKGQEERNSQDSVKQIEDAYEAAKNKVHELRGSLSQANQELEKMQKNAEFYGYTTEMSARQAGYVQQVLAKNNRAQYVVDMLQKGYTTMRTSSGEYGFDRSDLGRGVYNKITKTEYNYAQYLASAIEKLNVGWEEGLKILASQNGQLDAAIKKVAQLEAELSNAEKMSEKAYERMAYAHSGIFGDDEIAAKKKELVGAERAAESNKKLESSYKGLAEAVEQYVESSKKLWAAYDNGEDFSKFAEERNAAIEKIASLFPADDISGIPASLSQSGYKILLQSKEMSSQFAKDGAEATLKAIETSLGQAAEEVRLAEEAKAKQIADEAAETKRKQAEAASKAAEAEERYVAAAENAADAEERKAEAAGETRKQLEGQKNAQSEISAEAIIERDIEQAISQLRTAKDNETTLINFKGVLSGDDLVEQFSSMVQKIAEQANLSVGKITVKDNIAQVRLYNEELKVTVDQMYQLKQATEEADSAQLELVSQSFSQNVKALNENSFDVDGFRARATAAIEKVRSSLHGLEYDLTDLEKAAGNISSKEDFTKFNNQLKAAQDNIQAIKNATVSKSSMNQLANMQRDMKNANIELDTMRIKLQKIGDIDGVEDAKKMIDDMAAAAQKFNEAQDAQSQQDAYSKYSESRSSFKAQLEYLNAVKSLNASASKQTVDPIKEQYKSLLDTVNKINSINSDILKFQKEDAGSGLYSGYIKQLQAGKEQLIAQLQSTIQEINDSLSGGFVQGKEISIPSIKFLDDNGAVSSFLNDTKTQAALTAEEIDKLVASLQKAQSIDVQAAAKVAEQFRSVQETYKQIASLSSLDTNGEIYKGVENVFAQIMKYKDALSSDPTQWTPEQSQNLQTLIDKFNEYGNVLVQVGKKEQQYFAGKQKYTRGNLVQQMADDAAKSTEEANSAQQKLTAEAQAFAKELGANGAIVTKFIQDANGISKLDFSVLKEGTNEIRSFTMAMGSVTDGFFFDETTAQKSMSVVQSANNQLSSMLDLLKRLQASGVDMNQSGILQFVKHMKDLDVELKKPIPDETELSRLAKDAKISQAEVEKLYKKHLQLQDAIDSGDAKRLGDIDLNGNVYKQLVHHINAFAQSMQGTDVKIGNFNKKTGQLKFTMNAADDTVKEFTVSLDRLGKTAVAQETGVKDLGSKWDQFKASLSSTGKQLMAALVGVNIFYKAISEVRKGITYVKEIDLAMTELKKVTDETEASYSNFLKTASKTASVIGSTISDFTEATANFARLGYSMEESAKMAETAIVYKNVADGLDTVEESTESIISTMKAFGIASSDTMSIIDRYNEVGNNFAITSAGIGEALQRSASALYEAGNTIDESIGLVTAAMKNWLFIQKCIKRMHLIAGKSLEPYTTI